MKPNAYVIILSFLFKAFLLPRLQGGTAWLTFHKHCLYVKLASGEILVLIGVIQCHLNLWVTDQSLPPKGFHRPHETEQNRAERPQLKRIATCRRAKACLTKFFGENFREKNVCMYTQAHYLKAASFVFCLYVATLYVASEISVN